MRRIRGAELWDCSGEAPRAIVGATSFAPGIVLNTAVGQGIRGSAAGFFAACVIKLSSANVVSSAYGRCYFPGGWLMYKWGANSLAGLLINGAGGAVLSPIYTTTASDVGVYTSVVVTSDGSIIRLYVNGAQVGAGNAHVGYTLPNAGTVPCMMGNVATDLASHVGLIGGDGAASIPTLAQIQAWNLKVKNAGRVSAMDGVTTDHAWPVLAIPPPDTIGADNMVSVGSPTLTRDFNPRWRF